MMPEIWWGDGPATKYGPKEKLLIIVNDTELPQSVRNAAKAELQKFTTEH